MRIKTVMNHNQNDGLLKMIRRTDPTGSKLILVVIRLYKSDRTTWFIFFGILGLQFR